MWWGSLGELSKGSLSSLKYHPLLIFSFKILSSDSIRRFPPEKQKHEDLTLSLYFPDLCIYSLCNLNFPLPCQPTKALQEVVLLRKRGAGSTQNRGSGPLRKVASCAREFNNENTITDCSPRP